MASALWLGTLALTTSHMTTIIYVIIFGLLAFVIVRVFVKSKGVAVYSSNEEESLTQMNTVKRNLKEKWDIVPDSFWIPLHGDVLENTCYFNTNEFNINFGLKRLCEFINQMEMGKIYSFNESKVFSQIDKLNIDNYPGLDTYYTNFSAEWIIYITHENTIAFGGSAIIETLRTEWIELDKFINPWEMNRTVNSK